MKPLVSVILPVRDAAPTLGEAIRSILDQTFRDFDLWVVLNGCSDASQGIAEEASRSDSRVRVIDSEPAAGVAGAMMRGVAASRGELIARMDADDVSQSSRFARQVEFLDANPGAGAVSCGVELITPQGEGMRRYVDWVNGLDTPEAVARERFVECPVVQPSLIMRRDVLEQAGGYQVTEWAEDHDLFLRMLECGIGFGKVPEVLLQWRDGPRRLTRTHPAYEEARVWRMKACYLARLPEAATRGFAVCGAGPIGKRLARLLLEAGAPLRGFFEVNPRRIGERIHGATVEGPEVFGSAWRDAILLGAVGIAGGRQRVRDLAAGAGYVEGKDFWCVC
jgi:glycosyltransferase involved in cell wall biosynthesis